MEQIPDRKFCSGGLLFDGIYRLKHSLRSSFFLSRPGNATASMAAVRAYFVEAIYHGKYQ